jgi:plastin-1
MLAYRPILVLGLVWQIIKIQLTSHISLSQFPELVVLLEEGETLAAFVKLPPEAILLRWMNYHLKKASYPHKVNNFGSDVSDSAAYGALMTQIKPHSCRPITGTDMMDRAHQAIFNARQYGCEVFLQPKDIVDGNKKLNLGFVAQLFNTCHGLTLTEEERAAFDFSSLDMDDAGDTREERVLRMWINSLNIDGVYVNNLFGDLDDGVVILKIIDEIRPGTVEWKRCAYTIYMFVYITAIVIWRFVVL